MGALSTYIDKPCSWIGRLLVALYRSIISPWLRPLCRFEPTCSQYAQIALRRYGFFKGVRLSLLRLLRCHPGCSGGYDPVPDYEH